MRMLLNIRIPHEPFNAFVRDGTIGASSTASVRTMEKSPGKRKRLRGATPKSGRAGMHSTVIEVSVQIEAQIEAQQRLEERPEHGLAHTRIHTYTHTRGGKATPKHTGAAVKFCDGGPRNDGGTGMRRVPRFAA